eukprot:10588395-Lingulodinium_polyedra.AAC.1
MYLRQHPEEDFEYREIEHTMQDTLGIIRDRANQPARGPGHDTEDPDTEIVQPVRLTALPAVIDDQTCAPTVFPRQERLRDT